MLLSTIIILSSSSSFSFGFLLGAIIFDRRRLNIEQDRNYENLIYYLEEENI